jgi:hypothetical protein
MLSLVKTGRGDLDLKSSLYRVAGVGPEKQSTIGFLRGFVFEDDLEVAELFLGPKDTTRREGVNSPLAKTQFLLSCKPSDVSRLWEAESCDAQAKPANRVMIENREKSFLFIGLRCMGN